MKVMLRVFEVNPNASTDALIALPDRTLETESMDAARRDAYQAMIQERRMVRSVSFLADGGLVAYVLPPEPEPTPSRKSNIKRRTRGNA